MYYTLTTTTISFILEGPEQVAALRAKVSVDKDDIISVEFHEVFNDWHGMLVRLPGSYLPRWIMAGSYWTDEGWYFVYAKKPRKILKPVLQNVLVVTTKKDKFKYLVIESNSDDAKEIINWWKEKKVS